MNAATSRSFRMHRADHRTTATSSGPPFEPAVGASPARPAQDGALLVDAANVIGSRPNGWWRDRAGAACQFVEQLRDAARHGCIPLPAVVVLEGGARAGAPEGDVDAVRVVHAVHSGDDALVGQIAPPAAGVVVVTADRALRERVRDLGAETVGPNWLYERLEGSPSRGRAK